GRRVAVYPSPAGPTEADVDARAWVDLSAVFPLLACLEPDVEALIVRGDRGRPLEALVAPIDACYALVAIVRRRYRGFDGGDEVRGELDRFFEGLRTRGRPVGSEGRPT